MNIKLPYGRTHINADLSAFEHVNVLEQAKYSPEFAESDEVRNALQNPIGEASLSELARGKNRILLITNDMTRPMPSKITIPAIIAEIHSGNPDAEITILIASGLHRAMTQQELVDKMGADVVADNRVIVHDAYDNDSLAYFGELSTGNPLWLNAELLNADLVVSEGFIEAHWLAGYSGGRKSILPGIAGADTVMRNHCPKHVDDKATRPGNLQDNLAHREFTEAATKAKLAFILNVVLDKDKKIIKAFAGHPFSAHEEGCRFVNRLMSAPCKLADVTIVTNSGYPLDLNLYQSCKGLNTASFATKEGGVIILCTECAEGVGHGGFGEVMNMKMLPAEVLEKMHSGEIKIYDQWGAQVILNVVVKYKVIVVTDIERDIIECMGMIYAENIAEAVDMAAEMVGHVPVINVIPEGPIIIPKGGTGA